MEISSTTLEIESGPIPLETDADGVVRVGGKPDTAAAVGKRSPKQ